MWTKREFPAERVDFQLVFNFSKIANADGIIFRGFKLEDLFVPRIKNLY